MSTQPFAIPAVILFLIAIPLVLGLIPRNHFYGMRTPKTLSNERLWYAANRLLGAAIMLASAIYGAVAIAWPYDRRASDNFSTWVLHLAAFLVPILVGLRVAARYTTFDE